MSTFKHKLTVSMIVKNEEALLRRALESVKDADEIVILDTGSEDKTVEIAREFTDRVYTDYKWEDSFCKARNKCLERCTGDWILVIDADEYLPEGGLQKIREQIDATDKSHIKIKCRSESGAEQHDSVRVHRNIPSIRWHGDVHNYLKLPGESEHLDLTMTYGRSPAHELDKDRTIRILRKVMIEQPKAIREKYYLAREYSYRKEWEGVVYWADEYLKIGYWAPELAETCLLKARALWHMHRGAQARKACILALMYNANHKEAAWFLGYISGPKNKERWFRFAESANNEDVLFSRNQEASQGYWDKIYSKPYNTTRYNNIYGKIGEWVEGKKVLDVGCGTAALKNFIATGYSGFDICKNAIVQAPEGANVWVGDAFWYSNFEGEYDAFIMTEVLEHVKNDHRILGNIPKDKMVIFSVPSFPDPSHVRLFTESFLRERYVEDIRFEEIVRFNLNNGIWDSKSTETNDYILLARGIKK